MAPPNAAEGFAWFEYFISQQNPSRTLDEEYLKRIVGRLDEGWIREASGVLTGARGGPIDNAMRVIDRFNPESLLPEVATIRRFASSAR